MRLLTWLTLPVLFASVLADPSTAAAGSALYPPGLLSLVNKANLFLSTGQYNDAVKAYSEAIEQSPVDYLLFYKRATAYYSLSRHAAALTDFDQVLALTNDSFDKALLMKARIHTKDGKFPAAREAIRRYSSKAPNDPAVQEILMSISEGEMSSKKAVQAMKAKLWTACVEAASVALSVASHSIEIRQLRANCAIAAPDIESAVGDLTRLAHLASPSSSLHMKIFRLSYFLLPYSQTSSPALSALKQCLHFDPDSKPCSSAHRLAKSLDRDFKKLGIALADEKWQDIVDLLVGAEPKKGLAAKFEEALVEHVNPTTLGLPPNIPLHSPSRTSSRLEIILRSLCRAYVQLKVIDHAETVCSRLARMEGMENDVDALIGLGEAALKNEEWEDAVRILEKAFEASGRSSREVHQRLQRAQKLLKQSRQKDYYKVLGVSRDADAKTIKKAFRKAAMTAHPDKGGSEAMMAAVNEAYEVLNNPELRDRFDNGDDPNDPMAQQGSHPFAGGFASSSGGFPFAQFFQPSGGSFSNGFQFHFSHPGQHGGRRH